MNTLRTTALMAALLAVSLVSSFSAAQYDTEQREQAEDPAKHKPYFLPSRDAPSAFTFDRSDSIFHQRGTQGVFARHIIPRIGGVISQSDLVPSIGIDSLAVVIEPLASAPYYPGYLLVEHDGTRAQYGITYEDLVPIAIFAESGGTSIYTLFDFDESEDLDFRMNAGFIDHNRIGQIALEFAKTRFSDAILFIDICEICLGDSNVALASRIVQEVSDDNSSSFATLRGDSGYINTDLGLPYTWSISGNRAEIFGRIARVYWSVGSDGSLSIDGASMILAAEELEFEFDDGSSRLTDFLPFYFPELHDNSNPDESEQIENSIRKLVSDAHFLFRTIALLRTSRATNPDAWDEFLEVLASEPMVRANAKPWNQYAESLCSVFPKRKICKGVN